jgi:hypothetical protein
MNGIYLYETNFDSNQTPKYLYSITDVVLLVYGHYSSTAVSKRKCMNALVFHIGVLTSKDVDPLHIYGGFLC